MLNKSSRNFQYDRNPFASTDLTGVFSSCTCAQHRFQHAIVKQFRFASSQLWVHVLVKYIFTGFYEISNCHAMSTDSWAQAVDEQEAAAESVDITQHWLI